MKKKSLFWTGLLTVIVAMMDISGLPAALWLNIQYLDIEPIYFALMLNFVIIGFFAYCYLKFLKPCWIIGFSSNGLLSGLRKYALPGILAAVASFFAFFCFLPLDAHPSGPKILIEGIIYHIGVAIIEEFYVRGLLQNLIIQLASKSRNSVQIGIWFASLIFGFGHIPGALSFGWPVVLFKVIMTVSMGLYLGGIYAKTGNLWIPVILHFLINLSAIPYCFTTFSGYPTGTIIVLLVIYIVLGIWSILLINHISDGCRQLKKQEI